MAQSKPAKHILNEVTLLGSTIAELASSQLDAVLSELRGPVGSPGASGSTPRPQHDRVNVGTLAFNAMQVVSKVGDLLMQLSKYDLVRDDEPSLVLRSSNPITNLTVPHNAAAEYPLLIENNGDLEPKITLKATLTRNGSGRSPGTGRITFKPPLTSIDASERRRVIVKLPKLSQGTYTLSISASIPKQSGGDKAEVIATKTVTVNALPKPRQHGL